MNLNKIHTCLFQEKVNLIKIHCHTMRQKSAAKMRVGKVLIHSMKVFAKTKENHTILPESH